MATDELEAKRVASIEESMRANGEKVEVPVQADYFLFSTVEKHYLPDGMEKPGWYQPVNRGLEARIAEKLERLRALDREYLDEEHRHSGGNISAGRGGGDAPQ